MVRVYVKKRDFSSPPPQRTEVKLERIEGLPVEDLMEAVARQVNIDKQDLHLTYGGRILKVGKTIDYYQIKDGCTLHIMHRNKKINYASLPTGPEGMAVVFASSRIQSEMEPFIKDPELVAKMIPMGDPIQVRVVLEDPDLMAKISDIARINHHLHKSYLLFPVMKALLRLHRIKYCVQSTGEQDRGHVDRLSMQVGQLLELASGTDFENLIIPSEASTAHPEPGLQLIHGTVHSATPPSSSQPAATGSTAAVGSGHGEEVREEDDLSSGLPSLSVTPADLASALASIGTDQSDSQASSMSVEFSSQPLSLPIFPPNLSGSSAPASLQESELLPVPPPPPTVSRSLSDSGHGVTGTGQSTSGMSTTSSISEMDLQTALSQALNTVQQQTGSEAPTTSTGHRSHSHHTPSQHHSHSHHRHSRHQVRREQALRDQYTVHLQQLHAMGITYSDSECLHALEAAKGDLQTALELLMGDPSN